MSINWVLEREMFSDNHDRLAEAASAAGHNVISWDDFWWENGKWPNFENQFTVFHGSLGNANRIATELPWKPGVFCNTKAFECSAWYDKAKSWLIHDRWVFSTVEELVASPDSCLAEIGSPNTFFVRPNSPLKPFSGRVIDRDKLSLEALDYGFYYEDKSLPIVITSVSNIGLEWRFVIVGQNVITASSYDASIRVEKNGVCPAEVEQFAKQLSCAFTPPDPVYIMDISVNENSIKLIEINPFSGADLYGCDRKEIVVSIEKLLTNTGGQPTVSFDRQSDATPF